jgi:hypothetical protein
MYPAVRKADLCEQAQAELTRYDAASGLVVPFLGGVPGEDVSFSATGGGLPMSPIPRVEPADMPSTGKLRRFGCDEGDCTQYPNILRQPEGFCRDLSNEELFRRSLVLTSGVIYGEDH